MSLSWLLQIPDFLESLSLIIKTFSAVQAHFRGDPYEVLENEIELELMDTKGQVAQYRKRKKIRFLQNNIFAYLDTVFGTGKVLENYQCSSGKAVDFYEDGDRHRVLISFRMMKQRGDIDELRISRTIRGGYKDREAFLQTDITYVTQELCVRLIFPARRLPKRIVLIEKNTRRTALIASENIQLLADGRCLVTWQKKNPRLHESYILSWRW